MYIEDLKYKYSDFEILAPIVLNAIFFAMLFDFIDSSNFGLFILSILDFAFSLNLIYKIYGTKRIIITDEFLNIEEMFFYTFFKEQFNIDRIDEIRYFENERAETYTSSGHVKVLEIDVTPESFKEYDIIPIVIKFSYNDRNVKIGRGLRKFNAEKIVDYIKEQKK